MPTLHCAPQFGGQKAEGGQAKAVILHNLSRLSYIV